MDDTQPTTDRTEPTCPGRADQPCCLHMALQPWGIQQPNGTIVTVQPQTCCWCGPIRVHYQGIVEEGHGPWVGYTPASKIVLAQTRAGRG